MKSEIWGCRDHAFGTPVFGCNRVGAWAWYVWGAMILVAVFAGKARTEQNGGVTYADLEPVFAKSCVMCHSGDGASLGLRLDSFESVLKGSARGPVVEAGDPAASELVRRLKGISQPRMPMTGPPYLSDEQIALFERWVAAGLSPGNAAQGEVPVQMKPAPVETVTYAHVAPIIDAGCVRCHTDNGIMGPAPEGYRLSSYEEALASVDRVRVVPGGPEASELVRRIRGQARPRMPFDGPPYLTEGEIGLIEEWISDGARNPEGITAPIPAGARVRLHGVLESRWKLDELPLSVSSRTRIDKAPEPGGYVEVRGRLGGDGTIEVERIRPR